MTRSLVVSIAALTSILLTVGGCMSRSTDGPEIDPPPDYETAKANLEAAIQDTEDLLAPLKFTPSPSRGSRLACDTPDGGEGESFQSPVYISDQPVENPATLVERVEARWRSKGFTLRVADRGHIKEVIATMPDGGAILFGAASDRPATLGGESACVSAQSN